MLFCIFLLPQPEQIIDASWALFCLFEPSFLSPQAPFFLSPRTFFQSLRTPHFVTPNPPFCHPERSEGSPLSLSRAPFFIVTLSEARGVPPPYRDAVPNEEGDALQRLTGQSKGPFWTTPCVALDSLKKKFILKSWNPSTCQSSRIFQRGTFCLISRIFRGILQTKRKRPIRGISYRAHHPCRGRA